MNLKHKRIFLVCLLLAFTALFFRNLTSDLPLIFEKDLRAHDESSNSVVAANVTRKFFPLMVRVNPLNEIQGVWMEGPYWQHIPPLFAYVPYLFFELDGEITVEVKRLAYAFLFLISGIIFISSVYLFSGRLWPTLAATIAAVIWVNNPFTRALVTGYVFGVSDIVLAFSVICAFGGLLWYFSAEKDERIRYPAWKIMVISLLVAIPIMAKNLLGAIPAATFFVIIFWDHRRIGKQFYVILASTLGFLGLYYLPLYFASPEAFNKEIVVALTHLDNLEGWGRPWHYYLTEYLPKAYLFKWTWVYFLGLILGIVSSILYPGDRKIKTLMRLSLLWFLWNLIAISLVESKIANFIYQTFLFSIFAITLPVLSFWPKPKMNLSTVLLSRMQVLVLVVILGVTSFYCWDFKQAVGSQRGQLYVYDTEREKFFQAAEQMKQFGINTKDLIIIRVSDNDCWFRYPILFLTGAEAKTLLEMNFNQELWTQIGEKYNRMFILIADKNLPNILIPYSTHKFGEYNGFEYKTDNPASISNALTDTLEQHREDTLKDIERIKDDKTSCQWLVPDSILNAP